MLFGQQTQEQQVPDSSWQSSMQSASQKVLTIETERAIIAITERNIAMARLICFARLVIIELNIIPLISELGFKYNTIIPI